ncbi:MAG: hypothetical protein ACI4XS_13250 [Bacillus sp. (in: firmicutes)]
MNETRKKVILNEILYWKQTRILPEKYCDYLLALYSEGELELQTTTEPPKKKIRYFLTEILISLILMTALIVNYFTEIKGAMQMSLFTFFICLLLGITYYQLKKQKSLLYPMIAAAITLLLMSVRVWELFFPAQTLLLYAVLFINCLIWLVVGRKTDYLYFTVAGWLGLAVILYFVGSFFGIL